MSPRKTVRVALDARFRVESGASTYVRAVIPRLVQAAPDTEFLYVRYAGQSLGGLPEAPTIEAPLGSAARDLVWTNRALPKALRRRGVDLYHGLKLYGPLRTGVPMVHTVHSITRSRESEFPMSPRQRAIHEYGNAVFKRSCRLLGVSQYVSDFLVDELEIPSEHIRTVHLGVPGHFREALLRPDRPVFGAPGLGDAPYVVCVGNVERVKNHATAVRALARIRGSVPHHLVIAGRTDKPAAVELRRLIDSEGLADRVHLVGFLDLATLASCLDGAELQVHPSLSEGFCLSVLEGMCAGLPIIGSAIPGIVTVLGDAGLTLADPFDDRALADAILRWIEDPKEARRAGERARAASDAFTWERTAQRTLAVYRECLAS
ncbi:MAG: glycosyltransferase family 4 protein [Gemmatimonadetes bacterium]|nr:glycosyltransferase family 4 protein [Gemmatimonadota bacterium]